MRFCFSIFFIILFLASCEEKNNTVQPEQEDVKLINTIKIAFDGSGNKWFGNSNGLYLINGSQLSKVEIGIDSLKINCLVFHDNYLWAGTNMGAIKLSVDANKKASVLTSFDTSNCAIGSNSVYTIGFDKQERIWFGTSNGISLFDGTTWKKNKEILKNLVLTSGIEVTNLAFRENDCHFATNGKYLIHVTFLPETDAISGASQMKGGGNVAGANYNGDLTTDTVYCVCAGSDTSIWFGSKKGLTCNKGSNHEGSPGAYFDYYLEGEKVFAVLESSDGKVWAGTDNGLYVKSGSEWTKYNTTNGLNSNFILSIVEEADKSIWIETGKGVSQFIGNKFVNYTTE